MTALSPSASGRFTLQAWLGSRLVLILVLVVQALALARDPWIMTRNWDAQHYIDIATRGYSASNDVAFFPGLPLLMRAGLMVGVPPQATGLVVAMAGSLVAAFALRRLGGPLAAAAWLFAPTAVFTVIPYTESPFCAAAFWAWERAKAGRWWSAAALAGVASSFRVSGVFLAAALVVLALTTPAPWWTRLRRASTMIVPALVIGAFAAYLYVLTGSWTAWSDAQAKGWYRGFHWPWEALVHTISSAMPWMYPERPEWPWMFRFELVSMLVGIIVTVLMMRRKQWGEATFVGIQVVAFSFSYWFLSVNRAVLLWFPLFLLVGERAASWLAPDAPRGRRVWLGVLWGLALLVMSLWAWAYYLGLWAG